MKPSERIIEFLKEYQDGREKFLKKNIFERGTDAEEELIRDQMWREAIIKYLDEEWEKKQKCKHRFYDEGDSIKACMYCGVCLQK